MISFGWDYSAPRAANAVRAVMAEHRGSWDATSVAVAFGDHSAARIQNTGDRAAPEYINDKVPDAQDQLFNADNIDATADGDDNPLWQRFGRGDRQRAFIRFGNEG